MQPTIRPHFKDVVKFAESRRLAAKGRGDYRAAYFWIYVKFAYLGNALCAWNVVPGDTATLRETRERLYKHFLKRGNR
jgi:hypothetical protein